MNKLLVAAIAVLVIAGAFLIAGNKQESVPTTQLQPSVTQVQKSPVPTQETTVSVTVTKAGFDPQTLTIKAGTRVVWKNVSGETVTVNSDPHPTHSLYPFLNNLGPFNTDSSVQIVFDKTGTYTYHNHLNVSQTGKVIVE